MRSAFCHINIFLAKGFIYARINPNFMHSEHIRNAGFRANIRNVNTESGEFFFIRISCSVKWTHFRQTHKSIRMRQHSTHKISNEWIVRAKMYYSCVHAIAHAVDKTPADSPSISFQPQYINISIISTWAQHTAAVLNQFRRCRLIVVWSQSDISILLCVLVASAKIHNLMKTGSGP